MYGFCLLLLGLAAAPAADEPRYDLVLRGGKIVDGTGNPWRHGDLAISGKKIAAMGLIPAGAGKREIDAKGLVVSPGFIDALSHSDFPRREAASPPSKPRGGVTPEVRGKSGSRGPSRGKLPPPVI